VLGRMRALRSAAPLLALVLGGCAFSFEDGDGRRQVIGLFSVASEAPEAGASVGDVHRFQFYGVWVDDAFRGTAVAVGEVELTVADLRNQWVGATDAPPRDDAAGEACAAEGFGLRWCSLPASDRKRAGVLFDISVAGVSVGVGPRDRHFGVGYHRQTLLEVTNENALVAWPHLPAAVAGEPAQASVQDLLRGTFNG
jgi:hypothetical protein